MLGLRPTPHAGEIRLADAFPNLAADACELARFWVNGERSWVSVAFKVEWPPELLGSLLVECVQTAAAAYAQQTGLNESEVSQRIWSGIDQERERLAQ